MRTLRGFTIVEIVTGMIIVGIIGALGWVGYTSVVAHSKRLGAETTLRSVATSQEVNFRSRGSFVSFTDGTDALNRISAAVTDGAATGWVGPDTDATTNTPGQPSTISVATSGTAANSKVGLAMRNANGECVRVVVPAPTSTLAVASTTTTSPTCTGNEALTLLP